MRTGTLLILLLAIASIISCEKEQKRGELVPPPEGLEKAAMETVAQLNTDGSVKFKMLGLSVRAYPNDAFLVAIDIEITTSQSQSATTIANATAANSVINRNVANTPVNGNNKVGQSNVAKQTRTYIAQTAYQGNQPYWQLQRADKDTMRVLGIKDE